MLTNKLKVHEHFAKIEPSTILELLFKPVTTSLMDYDNQNCNDDGVICRDLLNHYNLQTRDDHNHSKPSNWFDFKFQDCTWLDLSKVLMNLQLICQHSFVMESLS
jgi:hypothetical protein